MLVSPPILPHVSISIGPAPAPTFVRAMGYTVWAERGEDIAACIAHEKRLKRWRRQWKFDLIERGNSDWRDLFDRLV